MYSYTEVNPFMVNRNAFPWDIILHEFFSENANIAQKNHIDIYLIKSYFDIFKDQLNN